MPSANVIALIQGFSLLICLILAVLSWGGIALFSSRMIRNFKDGESRWFNRNLAYNPYNAVFAPTVLTETGLKARKAVLISWLCLFVFGGLTALLIVTIEKEPNKIQQVTSQ